MTARTAQDHLARFPNARTSTIRNLMDRDARNEQLRREVAERMRRLGMEMRAGLEEAVEAAIEAEIEIMRHSGPMGRELAEAVDMEGAG